MPTQIMVVHELGSWRSSWDALVASAPVASPFMRSWWLEAVTGENARFVLVTDDGRLIGGLPLVLTRHFLGVDLYRCAGSGVLCPDHLDALALPDRKREVIIVLDTWLRQPGARILDLEGMVEHSLLLTAFVRARSRIVDVAPWEPLPDVEGGYLATRSANFRRDVRRTRRRLAASGVRHRRVEAVDFEEVMRDYAELQTARPGRARIVAELPRLTAALRAGADHGEAQMDVLETPSSTVAVSISFITAGRLSLYQNARALDANARGAGNALHMIVIEEAIAAGCHEVDLLRGAESYKSSFASRQRPMMGLRAAHGWRGRAILELLTTIDTVRPFAGRIRRWLAQRAEGVGGLIRRLTPE